ncbi:MAG: dihydrofolate reductase family protein [Clostridia bacterium]|nr:dihydrofolate reductase family protein [Clostridia bacterium]
MTKPRVICHMLTSIDGKVTGDFLSDPAVADAVEEYYRINREFAADAYACGRITMEGSFTGGWYLDLSRYEPTNFRECGLAMDCVVDDLSGFYAIAFDPKGRLGWKSRLIEDADPGYGGAQIIEVITEQVDPRYLTYLEELQIPYIFAGETEIDVEEALMKLNDYLGIRSILLEGGSVLDGAFQRAGVIDELSLVSVPIVADKDDKPLFWDSVQENYRRIEAVPLAGGALWLRYQKP